MELQVLKDNSIHVFGDCKPPRNKAQKKLLEYINECMSLNNSIDSDKLIDIYIKNVKAEKGRWEINYRSKRYRTHEEASLYYENVSRDWQGEYCEYIYRLWTKDCYDAKIGCSTWFQRALGSFVKSGHLIVIPKGYVLKKINDSNVK